MKGTAAKTRTRFENILFPHYRSLELTPSILLRSFHCLRAPCACCRAPRGPKTNRNHPSRCEEPAARAVLPVTATSDVRNRRKLRAERRCSRGETLP